MMSRLILALQLIFLFQLHQYIYINSIQKSIICIPINLMKQNQGSFASQFSKREKSSLKTVQKQRRAKAVENQVLLLNFQTDSRHLVGELNPDKIKQQMEIKDTNISIILARCCCPLRPVHDQKFLWVSLPFLLLKLLFSQLKNIQHILHMRNSANLSPPINWGSQRKKALLNMAKDNEDFNIKLGGNIFIFILFRCQKIVRDICLDRRGLELAARTLFRSVPRGTVKFIISIIYYSNITNNTPCCCGR